MHYVCVCVMYSSVYVYEGVCVIHVCVIFVHVYMWIWVH